MLENKTIMQVVPTLEMGGVERGTVEMATFMQKAGVRNIVVSGGGRMVAELQRLGVEHILLPVGSKNPVKMWMNARKLSKIITDKKVSLVHVRSRAPAWPVKWACADAGVPFITTFHGFYGLKPRWLKMPYNRVMTEGVKIIAVSDFVKEHIVKEYGVSPDKIVRIHRGADLNEFNPANVTAKQMDDVFNQFKIPVGKPIISLPGRFSNWKGHAVLVRALGMMRHKDVVCLLFGKAGSVEVMEQIQKEKAVLSPETKVIIIDRSMPMATMCALSTVVVSASTEPETFGRVAVEAQAMGRIIIATNIGGSRETVVDGVTGFLVPPNDAGTLAEKLDQALDMEPKARTQMEEEAMQNVQNHFSTAKMCEETVQVYEDILGQK